jgi:hypothetical protein
VLIAWESGDKVAFQKALKAQEKAMDAFQKLIQENSNHEQ